MKYSQSIAMWAITKASLTAIMRSPSAIVFSFIFPFIFILVFGFIGNSGGVPVYKIVIDKTSDTTNAFYDSIKTSDRIRIVSFTNETDLRNNMIKGRIAGVLKITKTGKGDAPFSYTIKSSNASDDKWPQLLPILDRIANKISNVKYESRPTYAIADFNYERDIESVRKYKTIDFILPGQLGFSLLSSGVFGVAFMFFNLEEYVGLKKIFCNSC